MATNEFNIKRTAFANFTVPIGVTNTVLTVATDAYIPAGAIVTGIRFCPAGAFTGAATFANATITPYVGAVAIGTNNRIVTQALVQTVMATQACEPAEGLLIQTGGVVNLCFGTTNVATSGVTADSDIYVDYLYVDARDTS